MNKTEMFVYHWVPKGMQGSILYPLNQLKTTHPEIYEQQVGKYKEREILLEKKVTPLDCLWNDVIHTSAIKPAFIFGKLREAGFDYPPKKYFKIPLNSLDLSKTCLMFSKKIDNGKFEKWFESFDISKFETYKVFSNDTLEYYKEMKSLDKHPLVYHLVPHILYKGTIDTTNLEIIEG